MLHHIPLIFTVYLTVHNPLRNPGHEIVATIAEIHLHPSVRTQLCSILPDQAKCHLAPIAAWADTIRGRMRETGPMHYINRTWCPDTLSQAWLVLNVLQSHENSPG
jgi:hypothetical protein